MKWYQLCDPAIREIMQPPPDKLHIKLKNIRDLETIILR